ncbi:MAG: OmpP1/FadL family transporter [Bacteriovoracaceae bacterium]
MKKTITFGVLSFYSFTSLAGGFEVNNLWSARYSAVGGAAVSNVEGAQALYFNPAGLSKSKSIEVDFNMDLGFAQKSAPLKNNGVSATTGDGVAHTPTTLTPIIGIFGSKQVNKRLGVGTGLYLAGGSGGLYKDVNFGSQFPELRPDIESKIFLLEFGAGAGYELMPGLSVGGAWRPTYLSLSNKFAAPIDANNDLNPEALLVPELKNLSDLILGGFRIGAQYLPQDSKWGFGVGFRSENNFNAKGKSKGKFELANNNNVSSIQGGDVRAHAKIPMQVNLGVHYDFKSTWRGMFQYDYTRNERVKALTLSGDDLVATGVGNIPISTFSAPLGWQNQHTFRYGTQWKANEIWTLRAGYVHASQVVKKNRTSPVGIPPAPERSIIAGAGRQIKLFKQDMQFDFALEHVTSRGTGRHSKAGSLDGTYTLESTQVYFALSYRY